MFALVRIHVPSSVFDSRTGITRQVTSCVWENIVENHKRWRSKEVRVLYMTHRHLQEDTSLIVEAKNPDALADFLLRHVATMENVRGIWVLNLTKMHFFRLPRDRPGDFRRFTVTIDAMPAHVGEIYERISSLKPGRDIIVTYIAYTFQSFIASIMVSVLARSRNHMEAFVKDYILPLDGVVDAETTLITKTVRLVTPEEWQKHVKPYVVAPGRLRIKDIEAEDDSLIAGC